MIKATLAGIFTFGMTSAALAQNATPPAAPPARPNCSAPNHRELDYWVGAWNVFDTAQGFQVATSRVERIMDGCSIRESYEAPNAPGGAYSGTSYSSFDRKDGKWHQMYVDVNGNVGLYVGALQGNEIVLEAPGRGGSLQRMTYRPLPDGSVQQIGLVSTDGGKSWAAGYDYTYRKQ